MRRRRIDISESKIHDAPHSEAQEDSTPLVEWWDQILLDRPELVNDFVFHPVVESEDSDSDTETMSSAATYLTEKEKKRARRLRRARKAAEIQDKIKKGILKPKPAKISVKNLVRIVGSTGILAPSATEGDARTMASVRASEHAERNTEARGRKRADRQLKHETTSGDTVHQVSIGLYRIVPVSSSSATEVPKNICFKVTKNAQQLHLSGCFIHGPSLPFGLVYVEGGDRAIRRFDRLVTVRVNWEEAGFICAKLGSGKLPGDEAKFKRFNGHSVASVVEMQEILRQSNAEELFRVASRAQFKVTDSLELLLAYIEESYHGSMK